MNLDRLLHATKAFAELDDSDIKSFLQKRAFTCEHLNLEFKVAFPISKDRKYDIRKFCKYIVGFSNEDGGLVVYGIADGVNKATVCYPDYVTGLEKHPTLEDLSQWVAERVHPLIQSPAIRFFKVDGHMIAILKVPSGINRPYCYCDPGSKALTFFKKTAGGIMELTPDQVRELYRDAFIEQSERIIQVSKMSTSPSPDTSANARVTKHKAFALPKLESVTDFGHLGIYCVPQNAMEISLEELRKFVTDHQSDFSEVMRHLSQIEPLQDGISVGYFPRAVRQNVRSTARITLYRDGLTAYDAQADTYMDRDNELNPYWMSYEILRQLQLSKALLEPHGAEALTTTIELNHIEAFEMIYSAPGYGPSARWSSPYGGRHEAIVRNIPLDEIPAYNGPSRNSAPPILEGIMDEVSRIFGLSRTPPGVWDTQRKLAYVSGLETQR